MALGRGLCRAPGKTPALQLRFERGQEFLGGEHSSSRTTEGNSKLEELLEVSVLS